MVLVIINYGVYKGCAWRIQGGRQGRPPGSKFLHFHAVFDKNVKNNSNFGSCAPPENPGSATGMSVLLLDHCNAFICKTERKHETYPLT